MHVDSETSIAKVKIAFYSDKEMIIITKPITSHKNCIDSGIKYKIADNRNPVTSTFPALYDHIDSSVLATQLQLIPTHGLFNKNKQIT